MTRKMNTFRTTTAAALGLAAGLFAGRADASAVTRIGGAAYDINASGQVAGATAGFGAKPMVWTDGTTKELDGPGAALAISDNGLVAAELDDALVYWNPSQTGPSAFREIANGYTVTAAKVTNAGAVLGFVEEGSGGEMGHLWSASSPKRYHGFEPGGMNSSALIVGRHLFSDGGNGPGVGAAYWSPDPSGWGGTMTKIEGLQTADAINDAGLIAGRIGFDVAVFTPDAPGSGTGTIALRASVPDRVGIVNDMNNAGTIVGRANGSTDSTAYMWTADGAAIDLNTLLGAEAANWKLTSAEAINDAGQVVGLGLYDPDGAAGPLLPQNSGFLITVPEPASLSVLAFGAGFTLLRRRRR